MARQRPAKAAEQVSGFQPLSALRGGRRRLLPPLAFAPCPATFRGRLGEAALVKLDPPSANRRVNRQYEAVPRTGRNQY